MQMATIYIDNIIFGYE